VSERKQQYQAGRIGTVTADRELTMTFKRVEWARIAVALRLVAKRIDSAEHLRLSREISQVLMSSPMREGVQEDGNGCVG